MALAGPFYFAWVEPNETTFNSSHFRMDEYIFSAKRTIAEGEKPLLEIEIQNPHVGILSPTRKYWAWFSWFNGSSVVPIFFGRVVGVPVQIFEEVITIQLVAEPIDYKQRVQRVAETLKYRPFYDQVFIDVGQRDDPNTVLEAHAKVWDVNPVTHAVTANDIIIGYDGNVDFTEDDHFYDSMQMTIGQPPATAILMDASVHWHQTARGIVDFGHHNFTSFGGDGMLGDWPKPLAQLGGGWSVYSSGAYDAYQAASATTHTVTTSYTNKEKHHANGDTLSANSTSTSVMGQGISGLLTLEYQTGMVWPGTVVTDQKTGEILTELPSINIAPYFRSSSAVALLWSINTSLVLQYEADRERTERIIFLVRADTQPVLTNPQLDQNSETINKSGADVGIPIINLLNWTTISGSFVDIGQIIFPDNPNIPGGRSVQIAVTAGTSGTVTPAFSDVPGFETVDGGVVWSSMGVATPPENAVDWTPISNVNAGTVILPKRPLFTTWFNFTNPSRLLLPPNSFAQNGNMSVSEGTVIQASNGSFQVCTLAGMSYLSEPFFSPTWGDKILDGSVEWTSLGMSLPSGTTFHIATTAGLSGAAHVIPPFNENLHGTTQDNTVTWTCIGTGDIPVGGTMGNVWAATYFATDRGRASLEYLAAVVRAKLLYRARCVQIDFDCEYERGINLTTRQTVTLHDPRIAGGTALSKIKSTVLSVGDTGIANCRVTLACAAGLGNTVTENPGDATYVNAGYVNEPYQEHANVTVVLPTTTDLGYAPPTYVANDDTITFPVTKEMVTVVDVTHVDGNQTGAVGDVLGGMAASSGGGTRSMGQAIQANPIWYELQIKPLTGQTFNRVYNVKFSNLAVPKGIDLQSSVIT